MMKIKICPVCAAVSSLWFALSAGVAWGYLASPNWPTVIAMLMGGSVIGISYTGEKKIKWAMNHPMLWKLIVTLLGMPIAYILVTNLTKLTVLLELVMLFTLAYFFFVEQTSKPDAEKVQKLEKDMGQCC